MDRTRELILLAIGAAYSTPENANKAVDADLAIEIADRLIQCGLIAPPPAASLVRRDVHSETKKRMGRPPKGAPESTDGGSWRNKPRNKKYECIACHHRFESKLSLLDVTCPECDSTNVIKQPQDRQI